MCSHFLGSMSMVTEFGKKLKKGVVYSYSLEGIWAGKPKRGGQTLEKENRQECREITAGSGSKPTALPRCRVPGLEPAVVHRPRFCYQLLGKWDRTWLCF